MWALSYIPPRGFRVNARGGRARPTREVVSTIRPWRDHNEKAEALARLRLGLHEESELLAGSGYGRTTASMSVCRPFSNVVGTQPCP
jgi:hypothetical protein